MPSTYRYRAIDHRGERRRGQLISADRLTAEMRLRRRGLTIQRLRRRWGLEMVARDFGRLRRKLPLGEVSWIFRNLGSLLRNGVTLASACELTADQRPGKRTGRLVAAVQADLEAGADVSDAFGRHRRAIGDVPASLVASGAAAGQLEPSFTSISSLCDSQARMRANLRRAVTYPITVLVTTGILLFVMIYFVVPRFEKIYLELGAPLPGFTRKVISVSSTVTRQGWIIPIAVALLVCLVVLIRQLPNGRMLLDRLILRLPRIGPVVKRSIVARCAKTLGMLLQAGVPMLDALWLAGTASGNAMIERAFGDVQRAVARGDSVASAFYSVDELPLVLRDLAAVGDSAGDVGGVMLRYAAEFEEDIRRDGEGIGKSLEPFLVVLLGALIGVVMVALYLPIFKLAAVVK